MSVVEIEKPKTAIDIERAAQWAVEATGPLPWDRTPERELAFDQGLTARPRRRARGNWALAEACAGLRLNTGRALPARRTPGSDAELILDAIRRLDPKTAATILACARGKTRPDWMQGVEPVQVEKKQSWRKVKKGHPRSRKIWIDPLTGKRCHPDEIRAAREVYTRWHAGLTALARALDGKLSGFIINGLSAPASPWERELQKSA